MSDAAPLFNKLCLIGLGLIGSSIARAARAKNAVREIAAYDASPQVLARVRELGIADDASGDLRRALTGADLVILCVPVGSIGAVARTCAPIWSAAPFSPMSARSRARSWRRSRRMCRRACISCRRIRSPAPNIPART